MRLVRSKPEIAADLGRFSFALSVRKTESDGRTAMHGVRSQRIWFHRPPAPCEGAAA